MFRGRYEHGVDSKGRLAIPAKFREILAAKYDEKLIITHFDQCLWAYPLPVWHEFERKIVQLPQFLEEVKVLQRAFVSAAQECALDKQGRILLPPTLRDYAGLKEISVLVGMTARIEIWAKDRWEKIFQESQKKLETMQTKLAELGL